MKIINDIHDFYKTMFNKNDEGKELTAEDIFTERRTEIRVVCSKCPLRNHCTNKEVIHECENAIDIKKYNPELNTILIIDDNEGMVSFLEDDVKYLIQQGTIKEKEYNILLISGVHAAFSLKLLYAKLPRLLIKFAIIDITLGGSKMTKEGNIKYTGVDVFSMIYRNNPFFKYIFYTGNNLNPYIKSNQKIIKQFKDIADKDIKDYILFKTSLDIDSRREYLKEHLFNQ